MAKFDEFADVIVPASPKGEAGKHSPGPWHLTPCSHGGALLIRDGITQNSLQIAPLADALLIAAAPYLLQALKYIVAACKTAYDSRSARIEQLASDAIAKAEGQEL